MTNSSSTPHITAVRSAESAELVGNPRRIRGLDASILERPAAPATLVGNPRRLRKLDASVFTAA